MRTTGLVATLGALVLAATAGTAEAQQQLDRAQLLELADNYFGALVAHDTRRVPLASNAKIVENAKRIQPGEGLWKTATSGPTAFKIVVPDPVSQQVAGIVVIQSDNAPVHFGFRLKLDGGRIVETEHMVVPMRDANNPNLQTVRPAIPLEVPYEYADSRGRLIFIAKSYYDALDWNNGSLAPFASDCERRENGMRTAPSGGPTLPGSGIPGQAARPPGLLGMLDCTAQLNTGTFQYIDTIDHRRVDIADTATGLVVGFSHFRHSMQQKQFKILNTPGREVSDMGNQNPFDLPAIHVYKIWGGQIHEIEAIGIMLPYNSPTGWE